MMYLSHLMIDVGDNPDRPRPGRLWLRNMYRVHQRLCMAFPSKERRKRETDPDFLKPYSPDDFPETRHIADQKAEDVGRVALSHVHAPRDSDSGFLFRVDPLPGASVAILVLSAAEPDWDYAFGLKPGLTDPRTGRPIGNAGCLLAAPPSKPDRLKLSIAVGRRFHFILTANPVRKVSSKSTGPQARAFEEKWIGKHVPVPSDEEHLCRWLQRRSEPEWRPTRNSEDKQLPPGFRLDRRDIQVVETSYVYFNKTRDPGKGQRLRSARYKGILEVTNSDDFRKTLISGIGPAKAFGFGLLSIKPV